MKTIKVVAAVIFRIRGIQRLVGIPRGKNRGRGNPSAGSYP